MQTQCHATETRTIAFSVSTDCSSFNTTVGNRPGISGGLLDNWISWISRTPKSTRNNSHIARQTFPTVVRLHCTPYGPREWFLICKITTSCACLLYMDTTMTFNKSTLSTLVALENVSPWGNV